MSGEVDCVKAAQCIFKAWFSVFALMVNTIKKKVSYIHWSEGNILCCLPNSLHIDLVNNKYTENHAMSIFILFILIVLLDISYVYMRAACASFFSFDCFHLAFVPLVL